MNPQQLIASALHLRIGFVAGMAFLLPELMLTIGATQIGICYLLACRAQNRGQARVHLFLMLAAMGMVFFLIALSSMVVLWAGDSRGLEVTIRSIVALCFLCAVLLVWNKLKPAMMWQLDKFLRRLASP